ncbi:serine/threonine/tyrosine-interacting protein B-like isoform X1 [Eriocheir sinensis]|uniref:serine/threonine/tyrosine-interacting protein B-like isoform X1 n=2 Tax=Eriocheir sinensis TaxID=95602 RepID=UPI0021CA823C|nr:serine/threonine/tyrosine-interacting protein B-like isoform X1 [Eriocheir sinensis]XP_050727769.1 serine/threonine/tyrosine-interacting protein B-like isoform X1 [Eriocheir sinensis]
MTLASSCYFLGPRCRISDVVGFGRGGRQLINVNMEVDWQYPMRREMQEILPGLYLGPYSAATKSRFNTLLDHGITHIICIRQSIESHMVRANFPDKIKYLILDMADNLTQNLISHVAECRTFIDECLASGGKCLVHGNLGISRSAALVVAYVMEKRTLSYREALEFVQNRRYCINPNDGFKQQLMEYEAIYKAQQTLLNGQCSQEKGKLKRKHDQTFDDFDQDSSEPMESVS